MFLLLFIYLNLNCWLTINVIKSFLLYLQAWKKRWFILRSGRMSGDPDVLEYYKSDHAKKPIRIIDLHCCEQVDAGLTFKRKEFQDSFVFDIKTAERTFYLVAETEEEMNRWVRSICQLCGFNQSEDNHHGRRITSMFVFTINTLGLILMNIAHVYSSIGSYSRFHVFMPLSMRFYSSTALI